MMLWSYIPLSAFTRPPEPARQAALSRLRGFLQRMRKGAFSFEPVSVQAELRSASLRLLDRVAPSPRWGATERALESALAEWRDASGTDRMIQVVVGPPGTGTSHVVRKWAERNAYRIIQPPDYRQIVENRQEWFGQFDGDDPVALPNVECFFLRHYNSFDTVRRILDRVCDGSRRYVIGCNSWTWAFLKRSFQIDALLPEPLTLSPFDSGRMERWLHVLASNVSGGTLVFRLTDDGSSVLPDVQQRSGQPGNDQDEETSDELPTDKRSGQFLQRLAARSRGNPLVGWAMWRQSLHIAGDEDIEEVAQEAAAADRGRTIWVRPWSQLTFPELPPTVDRHDLMLLHTLLLHDGLPAEILDSLLPLSLGTIRERLYRLRAAGLTKLEEGLWRVTLLGYPAVRRAVADEDLLLDDF
jgi:hypothetical protein